MTPFLHLDLVVVNPGWMENAECGVRRTECGVRSVENEEYGKYYARFSFYSWDLSCHHSQLQNEHFTLSVVFIVGTF